MVVERRQEGLGHDGTGEVAAVVGVVVVVLVAEDVAVQHCDVEEQ